MTNLASICLMTHRKSSRARVSLVVWSERDGYCTQIAHKGMFSVEFKIIDALDLNKKVVRKD